MSVDPLIAGVVGLFALIAAVAAGVRVYIAAGVVGTIGLVALIGWGPGLGIAGTIPHSKAVTYEFSVLPMFVLIGYLAFHAGITQASFDAARKWWGWLPGGLGVATVFASAGFSAVSGSSTATAAVFSRVAITEMLEAGYSRRFAAGVVAAGGTLASLIPPSAILVIYALIVEESVGKLLLAGFIPGILSAVIYAIIIAARAGLSPASAPPRERATWNERFRSLPPTLPIFGVIATIFSAIYTGWATPTEAGSLGAIIILGMALLRGMRWPSLRAALLESVKLTVMVLAIVWGVLIFVRFMGFAGLPVAFAEWITSFDVSPMVIMILILLAYTVLGMFMDGIGMLLLTLPIVHPTVIALGFDAVWFGIVVVKMVEICLITPPIGLNCYVVNGVRPDIPLDEIFRGILPFFICDVITVALFLMFPEIVTWLPSQMAP